MPATMANWPIRLNQAVHQPRRRAVGHHRGALQPSDVAEGVGARPAPGCDPGRPVEHLGALLRSLRAPFDERAADPGFAAAWPEPIRLSFNLSAVQLCAPGSAAFMLEALEQAKLPTSRLQVEVTETALLRDLDHANENLARLREAGVTTLEQVATRTAAELAAMHGVGPIAITRLREAMAELGLAYRGE